MNMEILSHCLCPKGSALTQRRMKFLVTGSIVAILALFRAHANCLCALCKSIVFAKMSMTAVSSEAIQLRVYQSLTLNQYFTHHLH